MKIELQTLIEKLKQEERFVLAIDGRCGAGKSTLAKELAKQTCAALICADDFFIPIKERSAPGFSPSINLDEERFAKEVLIPLSRAQDLCYGIFDCQTQTIREYASVPAGSSVIIEGSYTLYPPFRFAYTHTLFLEISQKEQRRRLLLREGAGAQAFFERWIPLEEGYFMKYSLPRDEDFLLFFQNNP
ncbi:MAG: hypothetical protein IJZ37_06060 [Clostridia bacterium]|nr:hypothetical protein [Clostridia bacterium]MBQ8399519.1 hypothetical protein [Clostridia bacterium]